MNSRFLLCRMTGPAILVLLGLVALLHQAGVVRFSIFVPLVLILIGVIKLAQRTLMMQEPYPQAGPYPGAPYQRQPYPGAPYQGPMVQGTVEPSATAPTHDFGNDPEGGK